MSEGILKKIKTEDVENALRFLIDMTIVFGVHEDGFLYRVDKPDERFTIPVGATQKQLLIYREQIPKEGNFEIINPFAEGLGKEPPGTKFFYRIERQAMNTRVREVLLTALKMVLVDKNIKVPDDGIPAIKPAPHLLKVVRGKTAAGKILVDEIDLKAYEEVNTFLKQKEQLDSLLMPLYLQTQKRARINCALLHQEDFFDMVSGMRKKTAQILKGMMHNLFPKEIEYTVDADETAPYKMLSIFKVISKVYHAINPALEETSPGLVVDLGALGNELDLFSLYKKNARWMAVTSSETQTAASAAAPGAIPSQTANIPQYSASGVPIMNPQQQQMPPMPQQPYYANTGVPQQQVPQYNIQPTGGIEGITPGAGLNMNMGMGYNGYPQQQGYGYPMQQMGNVPGMPPGYAYTPQQQAQPGYPRPGYNAAGVPIMNPQQNVYVQGMPPIH